MKYSDFISNGGKYLDLSGLFKTVVENSNATEARDHQSLKGKSSVPPNVPVVENDGKIFIYDFSRLGRDEVTITKTEATITARGAVILGTPEVVNRVSIDSDVELVC